MRIALLGNGMTTFLDAQYHILHEMNRELFVVVQPGRRDVAVESQRQRDTASSSMSGVCEAHRLAGHAPSKLIRQVLEF